MVLIRLVVRYCFFVRIVCLDVSLHFDLFYIFQNELHVTHHKASSKAARPNGGNPISRTQATVRKSFGRVKEGWSSLRDDREK